MDLTFVSAALIAFSAALSIPIGAVVGIPLVWQLLAAGRPVAAALVAVACVRLVQGHTSNAIVAIGCFVALATTNTIGTVVLLLAVCAAGYSSREPGRHAATAVLPAALSVVSTVALGISSYSTFQPIRPTGVAAGIAVAAALLAAVFGGEVAILIAATTLVIALPGLELEALSFLLLGALAATLVSGRRGTDLNRVVAFGVGVVAGSPWLASFTLLPSPVGPLAAIFVLVVSLKASLALNTALAAACVGGVVAAVFRTRAIPMRLATFRIPNRVAIASVFAIAAIWFGVGASRGFL